MRTNSENRAGESEHGPRILLIAVCAFVASVAAALLIMSWGFSMDDPEWGPAIFFAGAMVGNIGIVLTLLWAYRARDR